MLLTLHRLFQYKQPPIKAITLSSWTVDESESRADFVVMTVAVKQSEVRELSQELYSTVSFYVSDVCKPKIFPENCIYFLLIYTFKLKYGKLV